MSVNLGEPDRLKVIRVVSMAQWMDGEDGDGGGSGWRK